MAITKTIFDVVKDDVKPYIDLNAGNIAAVETTSTAAAAHLAGTQIVFKGKLYDVIQDIAQGGTIIVGTNIIAANPLSSDIGTLSNEVSNVKNALSDYVADYGVKNLLEHTASSIDANGIHFVVNSDGTVTVSTESGGATINTPITIATGITINKPVRLSGCPSGGSLNSYWLDTGVTTYADIGSGVSVNSLSNATIRLVVKAGTVITTPIVFKPMITDANAPNSDYNHYVPYAMTNRELTQQKLSYKDNAQLGAHNLAVGQFSAGTSDNVTFTPQADGTIIANSSVAPSVYGSIKSSKFVLKAGSYILGKNYGDREAVNLKKASDDSLIAGTYEANVEIPFTLSADTEVQLQLGVYSAHGVYNNVVYKPLIKLASDTYAEWTSPAMTNQQLTDALVYKAGDSFATNNPIYLTGLFQSSKQIRMCIPINKPITAKNATANFNSVQVFNGGNYETPTVANLSVSCYILDGVGLYVIIDNTSDFTTYSAFGIAMVRLGGTITFS